jgi:hypothetical protein
MIRDAAALEEFERSLQAADSTTYEQRLSIFWALLTHARNMGAMPPKDPLEGLEVDIHLARVLNALSAS